MSEDNRRNIRWDSDQIKTFLELYKQYPCLWDSSLEEYTKRDKRLDALNLLAYDLQEEGLGVISPLHLKTKIKSIKDTYRFELNKVKRSMKSVVGEGEGDVYTPKLSWFNAADCIWRNMLYGREASFNVQDMSVVFEEGVECGEVEGLVEQTEVTQGQPSCSQVQVQVQESPRAWARPAPRQTFRPTLRATRLGRIKKPTRLEVPVYKLEAVKSPARAAPPDDEYEQYGKYVASQLRNMPERNAVVVQSQINSLITTERLNIIDSSSTTAQYQPSSKQTQAAVCLQALLDSADNQED